MYNLFTRLILIGVILIGCSTASKTPVEVAYWEGYRLGQADAKQGFWRSIGFYYSDDPAESSAFYKGYQAGNAAGFKKKDKRRKRNN